MTSKPGPTGSQGSRKKKAAQSPLSIVAVFVGLVEAGLAYTVGVSSGWLQISILLFMGLFAISIAVTFFVFLWKRNWVFYPPSEFYDVSVGGYVRAMRGDETNISSMAIRVLNRALDDETLQNMLDPTKIPVDRGQATVEHRIEEIRRNAISSVRASVLSMDARPLRGEGGGQWEEAYEADMPVWRFIDGVWARLQPFPPYEYGSVWVLRDASSGTVFDDMGPGWGKRHGGGGKDERTIGECGIIGGMKLEVVGTAR